MRLRIRNKIYGIFCLFLVCLYVSLPAMGEVTHKHEYSPAKVTLPVSLAGKWKISLNDTRQFARPRYNDTAWDTVSMPGNLLNYIKKNGGEVRGVLWLRKTVTLNREGGTEPLGLVLGRISDADETFFNGIKIGGMGKFFPEYHSFWNYPRYYMVPENLINHGGKNIIAVRISYCVYAGITGDMTLDSYDNWIDKKINSEFIRVSVTYMALGIGLLLLVMMFLFFVMRPGNQEYLYYSLQLPLAFFIAFDLNSLWGIFSDGLTRFQALGISWMSINIVYPIFLHRFYNLSRKVTERILWMNWILMSVLLLFFFTNGSMLTVGCIVISISTSLGFYHLSCHITAIYQRKPFARLFGFLGMVTVAGGIHDGIAYLSRFLGSDFSILGYQFNNMIFPHSALFTVFATAMVLVYRFILLADDVEDLNQSLKSYIIENALLHHQVNVKKEERKNQLVTPFMEKKINIIIDYINDNYTSELSREELASVVDIHPDNLSKLFKCHQKINLTEYINKLRIEDTAEKLINTDNSISEIAFSAGFESLRTFNRVFPKFMKVTPEKYRKLNRVAN